MQNLTMKQKIIYAFKKYGYYMLLGFLVLGVVLTLIIVGVNNSNKNVNVPQIEQTSSNVTPYMPVLNATLYKDYYGDELCYNATLKQWETHNGIDLQVASGSKVYSILDGKVKDVYSNLLEGSVVVVEHEDGLTSCYGSLDSDISVKVGDSLSRGDVIGTVSSSATSEADAGAHLHFSMFDDGQKIDPASYLNISSK